MSSRAERSGAKDLSGLLREILRFAQDDTVRQYLILVSPVRLERTTHALKGRCSTS